MKKFVAGFVAAILLTSSFLFVYADDINQYVCTKVKYNILVDGEVYKDDKLPALVYEDNTYLPVRNFCNLLGADVEWNGELQQAEIKSYIKHKNNIPKSSNMTETNEYIFYTDKKYPSLQCINYNNRKYVTTESINMFLKEKDTKCTLLTEWLDKKYDSYTLSLIKFDKDNNSIYLLKDINNVIVSNQFLCIEYEYFIKSILSLTIYTLNK
ncbi:stalk domain-containing protein [Vallitalea guaymasensis]|uniref:Copper amine oxidase-like N-terminal domain-containing protein n=1 Tax=Vallitalea guaymasensis TaxID=1185412 RepID=A0A8J8SCP2_9FIRM|nr:stalk domain-containing protein [Vallitalea guaymasensis]QUH29635.1 hypothetical protein HYG85_12250 [Vallitalea guaymasensis]